MELAEIVVGLVYRTPLVGGQRRRIAHAKGESARMRNRALHDALREFALESAALLTDDVKGGAEIEFDVLEESGRRGPALYRYRPLTGRFIQERWPRLRTLASCALAAQTLGAGAAQYLRVRGLRGEQAEPALQAMLERLYEDATSFALPEERFERVYGEVERTLYRDAVPATVLAPLHGLWLDRERVELGDGLALVRGETWDAPPEAVWVEEGGGEPAALCVLERTVAPDDRLSARDASESFRTLVTRLRLFKAGRLALGGLGWGRTADGPWAPLELESAAMGRGEPWTLVEGEEHELAEFIEAVDGAVVAGPVAWALSRFEAGCGREADTEALSDYLMALRALLDATSEAAGHASLGLRLAALCAQEGERRALQRRLELALALERFVMRGGGDRDLASVIGAESPRELVQELECHLRALLRDVLCGYLDSDLKSVADDILLDSPDPVQIEVRDLRPPEQYEYEVPPEPEGDTTEIEVVAAAPARARRVAGWRPRQQGPAGVTPSADWGEVDEDPESYSAPV